MKISPVVPKRRQKSWKYDIEHPVYENACKAMESRPDYPQIERLWSALDERYKLMQYDDEDEAMYQVDLTELSEECEVDDEATLSHLRTMLGAGLLLAVVVFQEFNSVSVVVAPHMADRT